MTPLLLLLASCLKSLFMAGLVFLVHAGAANFSKFGGINQTALGSAINKALTAGMTAGTFVGFLATVLVSFSGDASQVFISPITASLAAFALVHLATLITAYKGVMFHPVQTIENLIYHPLHPLPTPAPVPPPVPTTPDQPEPPAPASPQGSVPVVDSPLMSDSAPAVATNPPVPSCPCG